MQYVSIDIETTGLDKNRHQIVEVGAVIDSLGSTTPLEDLPKFRAVLIHNEMLMGAYCAALHSELWGEIFVAKKQIATKDSILKGVFNIRAANIDVCPVLRVPNSESMEEISKYCDKAKYTHYMYPEKFERKFRSWLGNHIEYEYDDGSVIEINVAGKNAASFDIPFIKTLPNWQELIDFHRRVIDPAILCWVSGDEHLPDLQECLIRSQIVREVSHTAVNDALDVVKIIRANADKIG